MLVRQAVPADMPRLAELMALLWPEASAAEHLAQLEARLAGVPTPFPVAYFVAEHPAGLSGFVEVGLRSHADGCDPRQATGYLEGWYVRPEVRRRGIGRALLHAAELWAEAHGCREFASDTWLDNEPSQRAHQKLGFEVVDRVVTFKKRLAPAQAQANPSYGPLLARIHHEHFGMVAEAAGRLLLQRLSRAGFTTGRCFDLGAGTGILSRRLLDRGFEVVGVDTSEPMLAIARATAPGARFERGSVWEAALGTAVAVAAVGEVFNYQSATAPVDLEKLRARLVSIHEVLVPGGLLLFDVSGPGRSGPTFERQRRWQAHASVVCLSEREQPEAARLTRSIQCFVPEGELYRRSDEVHELALYDPVAVQGLLESIGYEVEVLSAYATFRFPVGWSGFLAQKLG